MFTTRSLNKDSRLAALGERASEPELLFRGAGLNDAALLRLLSSFGAVFKCVSSRFLRSVFTTRLPGRSKRELARRAHPVTNLLIIALILFI